MSGVVRLYKEVADWVRRTTTLCIMSDSGIKHTCHDCDRKFQTVKTLKTHMKNFHKNNATESDDGD